MDVNKITAGKKVPDEINVIIEISQGGAPVKYELDKDSGALVVDRFLHTAMFYPGNYGFIPHTLSNDGDPCDVLVISNIPVLAGAVIACRPVGVLNMKDESGGDEKIIAVPITKLNPYFSKVESYKDLPPGVCDQIAHFFQRYKDLEKGKFVEIIGWGDAAEAKRMILEGQKRLADKKAV